MAAFTWWVLQPTVGFDDANITQNYARNIAAGLGYVYYEGGERVEGSTSAFWTALNVIALLVTDTPETILAIVGLISTVGLIYLTLLVARHLVDIAGLESRHATLLTALIFCCFPALFGWTVWSLMETGVWCLVAAGFLWACIRSLNSEASRTPAAVTNGMALFATLMVLTRPEAIVLVLGSLLALGAISRIVLGPQTSIRHVTRSALAATMAFLVLTAFRLVYFGVPFPNTFYAKVSTDRISEIKAGARYTLDYLGQPQHLALIALAGLGVLAGLAQPASPSRRVSISVSSFTASVCALTAIVYTVLGGDHFGSHRYYLFLMVLLVPLAVVGIVGLLSRWRRAVPAVLMVGFVGMLLQWHTFLVGKGDYANEFRLAEESRAIGHALNAFADRPSVAVYIAGGIAMTYEGPIYDMLGLNWSAMARADRSHQNEYGAFSKPVFYEAAIDIVNPQFDACSGDWAQNPNVNRIFDDLFLEERFNDVYVLDCVDGMSFFRRRGG
jgi:hypothetical protein